MALKAAVKKTRKHVSRIKTFDEKYLGSEPDLRDDNYDRVDLIRAYNWYNYFCTSDDAKNYVLEYLLEFEYDKKLQKDFSKVDVKMIPNSVGWNCRILTLGGNLSNEMFTKTIKRIKTLAETLKSEVVEIEGQKKAVISIQDRFREKTYDLIGEIEEQIDIFFDTGNSDFDIKNWLTQNDIKPAMALKIADYYKPLYAELYDAIGGKDKELKNAYKHIKKPVLKKILAFVKNIIATTEQRATAMKTVRKPRKKKEKPAAVLVAKMKYLEQSTEYGITSVSPTEIIGSNQVWIFNTKYRKLTVLNAMGPAGLSVKGTTITGFDEKTSQTKALRKPSESLDRILNGGKIILRKLMDELKTQPQYAKSRINTDTVILRVVK